MTAIGVKPDAMSDGLALVRMRGDYVCAAECAAPWSLGFGGPGAHFHIVESGFAWLRLERRRCGWRPGTWPSRRWGPVTA